MRNFLRYLKRRAWLITMPLLLMMAYGNPAFAATAPGFYGVPEGLNNNLTLTAYLYVADADIGKAGNYYLIFNFNETWYLNNGRDWVQFDNAKLPIYSTEPLANRSIDILRDFDVSDLIDGRVYVGYGLSENDMLSNAKYALVYTVVPDTSRSPVLSTLARGSLGKMTLTARFHVAEADTGKTGKLYLAFCLKQACYFHDGSAWVAYDGGILPAYSTGPLANQYVDVLRDADTSSLAGGQLYIGYGLSETDMLSNAKYALVYTVPLSTDITVTPVIADGARGVDINTPITAAFSVAMNPLSFTSATVTVLHGNTSISGTLRYSKGNMVFTPSVPLANNTYYTATIKGGISYGVKDLAGNPLFNDVVWSWTTAPIDTTAPTVSSVIADGAVNVSVNTEVNASFSKEINPATLTTTTVTVQQGTTPVIGTLSYAKLNVIFIPSSKLYSHTYYTATIKGGVNGVKDLSGNPLASDFTWSWTTGDLDTIAPTVNLAIVDNASNVPTNTTVAATFNEAMSPASFTPYTVTVMQGTTPVSGTLSYSGGKLVFTPSSTLANNTRYTATIKGGSSGVKDLAGNPLASDLVWSWTTAAAVAPADTTAPTVGSAIIDGEFYVDVGTSINATFSEPMSAATINATSFTLLQGTTPVPGTLSYSGVDLVFTPSSPLAYNKPYTATIKGGSSGVKDVAGNPLTSDLVWSWITHTKPLAVVNLGTAGNFAVLSKTGVSSISPSAVTGNVGVSPAALTYITGFSLSADASNVFATSTQVVGKVYAANSAVPTPSNLTTAISDMELAYTDAAGRPTPDFLNLGAGSIGGLTLAPGLYNWGTGVNIPTDVVISGSATDIWLFQMSGDLNMSSAKRITLSGGALAKNIFWQVAGQAVIGTTAHFEGIILSQTEVILATGASMNGRALAQTAVTLDSATVTQP